MSEPISSDFRFEPHIVEVLGSRMHFVDLGEGEITLLFHVGPGSHFLQEDNPHLIGREIADWLNQLGSDRSRP